MMAYLGDFRFMLALTVISLPLLLLIRKAKPAAKKHDEPIDFEDSASFVHEV